MSADIKTWQERRDSWIKNRPDCTEGPGSNDAFIVCEIADLRAELVRRPAPASADVETWKQVNIGKIIQLADVYASLSSTNRDRQALISAVKDAFAARPAVVSEGQAVAWAVMEGDEAVFVSRSKAIADSWVSHSDKRTLEPLTFCRPAAPASVEGKAVAALFTRIDDAFENFERFGGVCEFEGQPMIYASTLTEIIDLAALARHPAAPAPEAPPNESHKDYCQKCCKVHASVDCAPAAPTAVPSACTLSEAQAANLDLVIARLEQISWNLTDDYRTSADEALVCARAIAATSAPTAAQAPEAGTFPPPELTRLYTAAQLAKAVEHSKGFETRLGDYCRHRAEKAEAELAAIKVAQPTDVIARLMRDWKTGNKSSNDVCVDLFKYFSSAPAIGGFDVIGDLRAIDRAMQHMGDVLNNMDAVEDGDNQICDLGFEAIERLIAAAAPTTPRETT